MGSLRSRRQVHVEIVDFVGSHSRLWARDQALLLLPVDELLGYADQLIAFAEREAIPFHHHSASCCRNLEDQ